MTRDISNNGVESDLSERELTLISRAHYNSLLLICPRKNTINARI